LQTLISIIIDKNDDELNIIITNLLERYRSILIKIQATSQRNRDGWDNYLCILLCLSLLPLNTINNKNNNNNCLKHSCQDYFINVINKNQDLEPIENKFELSLFLLILSQKLPLTDNSKLFEEKDNNLYGNKRNLDNKFNDGKIWFTNQQINKLTDILYPQLLIVPCLMISLVNLAIMNLNHPQKLLFQAISYFQDEVFQDGMIRDIPMVIYFFDLFDLIIQVNGELLKVIERDKVKKELIENNKSNGQDQVVYTEKEEEETVTFYNNNNNKNTTRNNIIYSYDNIIDIEEEDNDDYMRTAQMEQVIFNIERDALQESVINGFFSCYIPFFISLITSNIITNNDINTTNKDQRILTRDNNIELPQEIRIAAMKVLGRYMKLSQILTEQYLPLIELYVESCPFVTIDIIADHSDVNNNNNNSNSNNNNNSSSSSKYIYKIIYLSQLQLTALVIWLETYSMHHNSIILLTSSVHLINGIFVNSNNNSNNKLICSNDNENNKENTNNCNINKKIEMIKALANAVMCLIFEDKIRHPSTFIIGLGYILSISCNGCDSEDDDSDINNNLDMCIDLYKELSQMSIEYITTIFIKFPNMIKNVIFQLSIDNKRNDNLTNEYISSLSCKQKLRLLQSIINNTKNNDNLANSYIDIEKSLVEEILSSGNKICCEILNLIETTDASKISVTNAFSRGIVKILGNYNYNYCYLLL
jgi:hypothetical protein